MKNEALEKFETNLEKAKRLTKDNAVIKGIDLPDDNYFFKMLELAATPDKETCVGKPDSDTSGGLHLACVSGSFPRCHYCGQFVNPKNDNVKMAVQYGFMGVDYDYYYHIKCARGTERT